MTLIVNYDIMLYYIYKLKIKVRKMKISTFILGAMHTNCYFIIDEESNKTIIIDPADECDKLLNIIKERNLTVEYIFLTHSHFDHMMALEQLREVTQAPLCVHEHDAEAVTNPQLSYMKQFAGVNTNCKPAERLLHDGDTLYLNNIEIKVMHTPGHTMGSVCYFVGDNIITGDTLFKEDIGRDDLYGGDEMQLKASLKKLTSLESDYKIYPGHGSSSRLSYEKEHNIYLK